MSGRDVELGVTLTQPSPVQGRGQPDVVATGSFSLPWEKAGMRGRCLQRIRNNRHPFKGKGGTDRIA